MSGKKFFIHFLRITSILILYPYIVCFDSDSTSSSKLNITLGIVGGKYYPQNTGCGGITNPYYDFGGTIEYAGEKSRSGIKLGMAELDETVEDYFPSSPADTIKKGKLRFSYIIPYLGFADKYAELRIGIFFSNKKIFKNLLSLDDALPAQISFFAAIRSEDDARITFAGYNNCPLLMSGGVYETGAEYRMGFDKRHLLWGGVSFMNTKNISMAFRYTLQSPGSNWFMVGAHAGMDLPFYLFGKGKRKINYGFFGAIVVPVSL